MLNVVCVAPPRAARLIAAALRASEAFNSMTFQPLSFAIARTILVFPTPGGPVSNSPLRTGGPSDHERSQFLMRLRTASLPSSCDSERGRYRSVQSEATSSSLINGAFESAESPA